MCCPMLNSPGKQVLRQSSETRCLLEMSRGSNWTVSQETPEWVMPSKMSHVGLWVVGAFIFLLCKISERCGLFWGGCALWWGSSRQLRETMKSLTAGGCLLTLPMAEQQVLPWKWIWMAHLHVYPSTPSATQIRAFMHVWVQLLRNPGSISLWAES